MIKNITLKYVIQFFIRSSNEFIIRALHLFEFKTFKKEDDSINLID